MGWWILGFMACLPEQWGNRSLAGCDRCADSEVCLQVVSGDTDAGEVQCVGRPAACDGTACPPECEAALEELCPAETVGSVACSGDTDLTLYDVACDPV